MSERRVEKPISAADLPPMHEGLLPVHGLAAYQRDLETCAEVRDVRVKGAALAAASESQVGLDAALRSLHNGEAAGVQIRYRYQGEAWCDTLMRGKDGVRLIRVRAFEIAQQ